MVKSKEDKPLEKVSKIKEGKTKAKEKAGKLEESEDNLKKRTSDRSVLLKEIKENIRSFFIGYINKIGRALLALPT